METVIVDFEVRFGTLANVTGRSEPFFADYRLGFWVISARVQIWFGILV